MGTASVKEKQNPGIQPRQNRSLQRRPREYTLKVPLKTGSETPRNRDFLLETPRSEKENASPRHAPSQAFHQPRMLLANGLSTSLSYDRPNSETLQIFPQEELITRGEALSSESKTESFVISSEEENKIAYKPNLQKKSVRFSEEIFLSSEGESPYKTQNIQTMEKRSFSNIPHQIGNLQYIKSLAEIKVKYVPPFLACQYDADNNESILCFLDTEGDEYSATGTRMELHAIEILNSLLKKENSSVVFYINSRGSWRASAPTLQSRKEVCQALETLNHLIVLISFIVGEKDKHVIFCRLSCEDLIKMQKAFTQFRWCFFTNDQGKKQAFSEYQSVSPSVVQEALECLCLLEAYGFGTQNIHDFFQINVIPPLLERLTKKEINALYKTLSEQQKNILERFF